MITVPAEGQVPGDHWWPWDGADDLRAALRAAYASPARHYHDLRHLTEVLTRVDELIAVAPGPLDRGVLLLAAWFHDSVYDGEPGAEDRSARWAERALPTVGLAADRVAEVARLVRLTEHHDPAPDDRTGGVLSDADLAILAADDDRYAEYTAAVRAEYAHVPDAAFAAGRTAVLRDLLAKPALYATAHARRHWEQRARANLTAEIARLAG